VANGPSLPSPASSTLQLLSQLIVQVGFPVVVAGVLLWFLLTKFQHTMDTITSRMERNADVVAALVDQQETGVKQQDAAFGELQAQTRELRAQTDHLAAQSKLMGDISADAQTLVDLRKQELETMQRQLEVLKAK
jgi:methyl-accepting chemotaxis protein